METKETWCEEFKIGYDKVDHQYKKLFTILDDLTDINESDKKSINKIIKKLEVISESFDIDELKVLKHTPELDELINNHQVFITKIQSFIDKYKSDTPLFVEELVLFLKRWLMTQIILGQRIYKNNSYE